MAPPRFVNGGREVFSTRNGREMAVKQLLVYTIEIDIKIRMLWRGNCPPQ